MASSSGAYRISEQPLRRHRQASVRSLTTHFNNLGEDDESLDIDLDLLSHCYVQLHRDLRICDKCQNLMCLSNCGHINKIDKFGL